MKAGLIAVLIIVAIAAVYLLNKGSTVSNPSYQTVPSSKTTQTEEIQNDSDLMSSSTDLDNTDVNTVDSDLNQNQTDASTF